LAWWQRSEASRGRWRTAIQSGTVLVPFP